MTIFFCGVDMYDIAIFDDDHDDVLAPSGGAWISICIGQFTISQHEYNGMIGGV
jgi:hypothetical protein